MKRGLLVLGVVLGWTMAAGAQAPAGGGAPAAATQPAPADAPPVVDPKALDVLKAMSAYLAGLKSFTFEADADVDHVLDAGQLATYTNTIRYAFARPDKIAISDSGDTPRGSLIFDGKTLTLFNRSESKWGQTALAGTVDTMLEYCARNFELIVPLGDLFFSDPYKVFVADLPNCVYVGQVEREGKKVHHLAGRTTNVDWQIWVTDGKEALPVKVVIDFNNVPGEPRFAAVLRNWKVNVDLPASTFTFTPPAGVEKVDLAAATQPAPEPAEAPLGK